MWRLRPLLHQPSLDLTPQEVQQVQDRLDSLLEEDPLVRLIFRRVQGLWAREVSRLQGSEESTERLNLWRGRLQAFSEVWGIPDDLFKEADTTTHNEDSA
jgi:hypothetical protein